MNLLSRPPAAVESTVATARPAPASEPDAMTERMQVMEQRVAELTSLLADSSADAGPMAGSHDKGRLLDLERKATQYDALTFELQDRKKENQALTEKSVEQQAALALQNDNLAALRSQTNELSRTAASLRGEVDTLKELLRILRLGPHEYYTIQPNDTCETIAAQPMIYGDRSKHILIRQMNRGMVADLDKLKPGEVLLIPRPEGSARNEF